LDRMRQISEVLEGLGFTMQIEKAEVGRRIVFLGILIDTVRMTVSFDAVQAKGMKEMLMMYLHKLKIGEDLETGLSRHIAGCLNWYSEVLQSGRTRLRSWWMYVQHGPLLNSAFRRKLIQDTEWWLEVLSSWEQGEQSGREYPILSMESLRGTPDRIWVLQSDASGPDGFGYHHGQLESERYSWVSHSWDADYYFSSSHDGELAPLLHYMRTRQLKGCLLIWVSDSLSAVWSVNKGRCHAPSGLLLLEEILGICDECRVQLVPLWVPREENMLADYLSHLSASFGRQEVRGIARHGASGPGENRGNRGGQE
jgi:hypothetical protein